MATTVQPPETEQPVSAHDGGKSGGGGLLHLGPVDQRPRAVGDSSPEPVRTGIWVGLAAITMSFAAFTSALVVRQSTANDWHHLAIPPIVFVNTLFLVASSTTLEIARRRLAAYFRGKERNQSPPIFWLGTTFLSALSSLSGNMSHGSSCGAKGCTLLPIPIALFFMC